MLRAAQSSLKLVIPTTQHAAMLSSSRAMSVEGVKGFKENQKVIEDIYFTKEDQRILGKLLNKVKNQSDVSDEHSAEGIRAAELSQLKSIIGKYNISSEDVEKLIKWKHTYY